MDGPSYPAARVVAERIQARLAKRAAAFQGPGDTPQPDAFVIEEVISAAFWASLLREEGRWPTISLAFVPPEQVDQPLTFGTRLRLEPHVLARLAPAVERPGIHLGVWAFDDQLCIWGTTRRVPTWCFVLETVAPGLLVVKYRRPEPTTKFANVAVLEGAGVKFVEQQAPVLAETPAVVSALLAFYSSAGHDESDNILVRLAVSMRAHGHGGSLLVVPKDRHEWRNSIRQPTSYGVDPPFSELEAIDALAGLTAVDGATVINDQFELLAFGVKIVRPRGAARVEQVLVTEPIEGSREEIVEVSQLGNTRHLSATQFVSDQRDSIALVASQDGRVTVFAWSPLRDIVHARRLEALLL
jgi:DNA integrity scanning protein DisA with diadenylate cyclase activity